MGTLLFLLSSYPLVGDPTPEPTATPEVIPSPHKNSSGLDLKRLLAGEKSDAMDFSIPAPDSIFTASSRTN